MSAVAAKREGGRAVGEGSLSDFAEVTSRHQLDFNGGYPIFCLPNVLGFLSIISIEIAVQVEDILF